MSDTRMNAPDLPREVWSPIRIMVGTVVILCVLLGAWIVVQISSIILILVLGVVFAAAIEPLVYRFRRAGVHRSQAIGLAYLLLFGTIGIALYFLIPQFVDQVSALDKAVPDIFQRLRQQALESDSSFINRTGYKTLLRIQSAYDRLRTSPSIGQDQAFSLVTSVLGGLFTILSMMIVAFYWLTEKATIKRIVLGLFPFSRRSRAHAVWDEIEYRLGGWTRGQLTLMAIIGTLSGIGFFIIGIPFWLALGFLSGITEAIPYIGPFIGGSAAVLIALSVSPEKALLAAGFVLILQQVEGAILVPRIMKNAVGMSPLTVTVTILIGGVLYGPVGSLLAIPLGAAAQVLVSNLTRIRDDRIANELRYMELTPLSAAEFNLSPPPESTVPFPNTASGSLLEWLQDPDEPPSPDRSSSDRGE